MHWREVTDLPWAGVGEIRVARPGNLITRLSGLGAYGMLVVTTTQADFARRAGTRPTVDHPGWHPDLVARGDHRRRRTA